jgi:glycogen debranching enzyme
MEDTLAIEDRHSILAGSTLGDPRTLVLKDDRAFAVFGPSGDIDPRATKSQGLFKDDMRYLSRLEVRLQGRRPICLGASASTDNTRLVIDLTNPDILADGHVALPRCTAQISRSKYLAGGALFERLALANFGDSGLQYTLAVAVEADFEDIFHIRGTPRPRRGKRLEPVLHNGRAIELAYDGLDGARRRTLIEFDPPPERLSPSGARFIVSLEPGQRQRLSLTVRCDPGPDQPRDYPAARRATRQTVRSAREGSCRVRGGYEHFTRWAQRSFADARMLLTPTPQGLYPYAGIPWYCTPFGRDGIITALQLLWVRPGVARGVLAFLAANQARDVDDRLESEPGKILHEFREGEMASTGQVPFGRYYGTVDATPLFVMLAGEYLRVSGDVDFLRSLWPAVELALGWCDTHGDPDRDGFLEYQCRNPGALANQGWKDSHDAVFHADGTLARGPIALCEVQGYAYAARLAGARIARALGEPRRAADLAAQARALKDRFHEAFWVDSIGVYAIALDGDKRPCAIRSSNPGHCLWTGIADEAAAPRLAREMLSEAMFSGWGVRTIAQGEARYNPMSYHNGSVWPHDNAILMAGLARYGQADAVERLMAAWLEASEHFESHRLPELFCGFARRISSGPTSYPVACSPQAWAAGAFFMMLEACLGLEIHAGSARVSAEGEEAALHIRRARLPARVGTVCLRNLRIGPGSLDLLFHREREDVGVLVRSREGSIRVLVEK